MTESVKGGDAVQVVEVATHQLTEHSLQAELSPTMSEKAWRSFVAGIAANGIMQPVSATKGFRVIDGKHRLRAAKELGIESIRVVFEDIPEDKVASYITETKLNRDDLKKGQKAAIVINLYYEEERRKARLSQGTRTDISPELEKSLSGEVAAVLAKKAGVSKTNIYYLLAVKRKRPDIYEKVFDGLYSIGKAHAEMKRDEQPQEVTEEKPLAAEGRALLEKAMEEERLNPQIDETQPAHSPHNRLVSMRKKALSVSAEVLDESDTLDQAEPELKTSVRKQLMSMVRSGIISLGQTAETEEDAEILAVCLELLSKINGGN